MWNSGPNPTCFLHSYPQEMNRPHCKSMVSWAESHCWWSEGLGSEGGVGSPSARAKGGMGFSSSVRERRWQGVSTAFLDLWPNLHLYEEDVTLEVSVPDFTPSLQLGWSAGYLSPEKFITVHPAVFYSEDARMQVLRWTSEPMLLICYFCEMVYWLSAGSISSQWCRSLVIHCHICWGGTQSGSLVPHPPQETKMSCVQNRFPGCLLVLQIIFKKKKRKKKERYTHASHLLL